MFKQQILYLSKFVLHFWYLSFGFQLKFIKLTESQNLEKAFSQIISLFDFETLHVYGVYSIPSLYLNFCDSELFVKMIKTATLWLPFGSLIFFVIFATIVSERLLYITMIVVLIDALDDTVEPHYLVLLNSLIKIIICCF